MYFCPSGSVHIVVDSAPCAELTFQTGYTVSAKHADWQRLSQSSVHLHAYYGDNEANKIIHYF